MLVVSLSGCSHYWDQLGMRNETVYPAAFPVDNPAPPKRYGSIYQSGHEISLYDDRIANRVGDILTVRLEETTQGQKKSKTRTRKIDIINTGAPTILGGDARALQFANNSLQDFNGEGDAEQQNRLQGTISVSVIRVLSNGNLVVQGESWLTINQGREYVRLSGIVRREDIEPNNTISSQRVSDARISYSGNGQVADSSRGGMLTQLMLKFFPY
jgi:flagellar L-ring protein precursor FlgH